MGNPHMKYVINLNGDHFVTGGVYKCAEKIGVHPITLGKKLREGNKFSVGRGSADVYTVEKRFMKRKTMPSIINDGTPKCNSCGKVVSHKKYFCPSCSTDFGITSSHDYETLRAWNDVLNSARRLFNKEERTIFRD